MSTVEDLEEQEDKPHVGWVPKVLTGGKGPPEAPTSNWLSTLLPGTYFQCRQNKFSVDFEMYAVIFVTEQGNYLLKWEMPDGKVWDRRVDPSMFSKHYREYEVLGVFPIKPPTEEVENEQRNPRRPPDLVLHEAVQGEHQVLPSPEGPDL